MLRLKAAARLFKHAINLILIVQLEHLRRLIRLNTFPIQEETEGTGLNTLSLRIGFKDLLHLCRLLDLEKGFFTGL